MGSVIIRPEEPADFADVCEVVEDAFGSAAEARLVDALRELADDTLSLVATQEDRVIGHVFFSPVQVRGPEHNSSAFALAPLAVTPNQQKSGIGQALVRSGLSQCADLGEFVVFVLGHVDYYPRFGFRPATPKGLYYRRPGDNPSFMVIELADGALAGRSGEVVYAEPFSEV